MYPIYYEWHLTNRSGDESFDSFIFVTLLERYNDQLCIGNIVPRIVTKTSHFDVFPRLIELIWSALSTRETFFWTQMCTHINILTWIDQVFYSKKNNKLRHTTLFSHGYYAMQLPSQITGCRFKKLPNCVTHRFIICFLITTLKLSACCMKSVPHKKFSVRKGKGEK